MVLQQIQSCSSGHFITHRHSSIQVGIELKDSPTIHLDTGERKPKHPSSYGIIPQNWWTNSTSRHPSILEKPRVRFVKKVHALKGRLHDTP